MPNTTQAAVKIAATKVPADPSLKTELVDKVIQNFHNYFIYYQAIFFIILSIILFFIVRIGLKRFVKKMEKIAESKNQHWNKIIFKSIQKPSLGVLWVILISLLLSFLRPFFSILDDKLFYDILRCAVVFCLFWFCMGLISGFKDHYSEEVAKKTGSRDVSGVHAIAKLLQILLSIVAILFILPIFSVNISGLLTVGGVSTIVLGFAAKDMLTNFLGGLMIYFDRPFAIGDWISSPDRNIEGTVEHIGWRLSIIRSFDKRPIYVPNGVFGQIILVNPSRMTNRRIKKNIGVRYDDADVLPKILGGIRDMLANHPEIDQGKLTLVNLVEFSASSIDFMIYTFTKTTDWEKYQMIQDDVMLKCEAIVREHGAECAFPTTTLHVPEGVSVDMANQ
jgi:MscS family membrane protein